MHKSNLHFSVFKSAQHNQLNLESVIK